MATELTITEQAGDTFSRAIELSDSSGNTIDITGWTFVLSIKEERSDSDADAIIREEVTTHDAPTEGRTSVEIPATETGDLFGDYWYDLKFKTDTDEVTTIVSGVFRVEDSITDDI